MDDLEPLIVFPWFERQNLWQKIPRIDSRRWNNSPNNNTNNRQHFKPRQSSSSRQKYSPDNNRRE